MLTVIGLIVAALLAIFAIGVVVIAGAIVVSMDDPRVW